MVGCRVGEVLTVVKRTTAAYDTRGHQWWSRHQFGERSARDHKSGLTWRADTEYEVNVLNDVHSADSAAYFLCLHWTCRRCTSHLPLRCFAYFQEARHLGEPPHRRAPFFTRGRDRGPGRTQVGAGLYLCRPVPL